MCSCKKRHKESVEVPQGSRGRDGAEGEHNAFYVVEVSEVTHRTFIYVTCPSGGTTDGTLLLNNR